VTEPTRERIGVFGGTFDPPHLGHLIVAAELRWALRLDRLLFVPAGRPPHKPAAIVSDDDDRLAMLELALADDPSFEVSTDDLDRPGPSFTADLLALLSARMSPATLVFLMGEDSLRDLPNWSRPEQIVTLAEIGVATRPGIEVDLASVYAAVPPAAGRISLVETPSIGISSTDLRQRVAEGAPIRHQVPAEVEAFIARRGLYREIGRGGRVLGGTGDGGGGCPGPKPPG
jgi:nicotinate-nucleotide adenylyltransferase